MRETLLMCIMQAGGGETHACSDQLFHVKHHAKYFACAKVPVEGVVLSPFAHEETGVQRVE